eukprot:07446_1
MGLVLRGGRRKKRGLTLGRRSDFLAPPACICVLSDVVGANCVNISRLAILVLNVSGLAERRDGGRHARKYEYFECFWSELRLTDLLPALNKKIVYKKRVDICYIIWKAFSHLFPQKMLIRCCRFLYREGEKRRGHNKTSLDTAL